MLGKLTAVAAASLTIGTLALPAGVAFAHSNHVRATCDIGVNVEAHDYPAQPAGASASVTVEFDGDVTFQQQFGPAIKANAPNPDKTVAHSYRVTFDRFDYVGPDGDMVYTGTIPACAPATTSTTSLPGTTTTTTGPEIACVLGPDGHYNFAGTNIPCEGPPPATTTTSAPTTTLPATFTCAGVMVADVCVVPTTTVAAPPGPPSSPLPITGNKTDIELSIALSALAIGYCLLRIRRSRA